MTVLAAALAAVTATAAGADRVAVAALLALAVGALCLLARALRLGVLASFLSRPILTGFFIGISLSILVGQIGRFTGVQIEADGLIRPFVELARKAGSIHWPSVALAFAMLAVLQGVKATRFPVPGPLVVVVLAVLLSAAFDFRGHGIAVVGDIPTRLPSFAIPSPGGLPLDTMLLGACAIFAVAFSSGIVTARSFGAREGTEVEPDRELIGFGAANLAAGCFGGFPVTAASSRTAVNLAAGGRSQLAGIVAAVALTATLVFLGGVLRILPVPALGAILVAAALGMIQVGALREIWRISRMEFAFALIAMWGPIGLGVLNGVVIAIGATLFYLLRKMMYPRYAMLGRIPGRGGFYKLHRRPEARPVPGLAICLIQGSLLFFNSDTMRARLRAFAAELPPDTRWLVLDAGAIVQVDSTAAAMLDELRAELAAQGIALGLADLHFDVRALLDRAGVIGRIGPDMIFNGLDGALRAFEATARGGQDHGEEAKSRAAEADVGLVPEGSAPSARVSGHEDQVSATKKMQVVSVACWSRTRAAARVLRAVALTPVQLLDAYLRLLRRWRWSLLLAILLGTFLLQPLWPRTPLGELLTFTLAMAIFGGAIYAGRTGPCLARPAGRSPPPGDRAAGPRLRRRSRPRRPSRRPRARHRRGGDGRDLRRAARQPRGDHRRPRRRHLRLPADRRRLVAALPPARDPAPRLVPPRRGRPRHPAPLLQPDHHHHGRLRRRAAAHAVARIWAALEAVVGTLYIAILIGRIVGELRFGRSAAPQARIIVRVNNRKSLSRRRMEAYA